MSRKINGRRKKEEVVIELDDGKELKLICQTMSGSEAGRFNDARRDNHMEHKTGKDGVEVYTISKLEGIQELLICASAVKDNGDPVTMEDLKDISSEAIAELYDLCSTLNGENKESQEELKKA